MRDLYGDEYESVAVDGGARLIPNGIRRLTSAVLFVGIVAGMGLWAYRLGTRDAAEVPIIKAMAGPARIAPEDPGGAQAPHQGLEVNSVLAGHEAPMPRETHAAPPPQSLEAEDEPQGELLQATPAMLTERLLAEAGELPSPSEEDAAGGSEADGAAPEMLGDGDIETAEVDEALPEVAPGPRPRSRPANLVVARARTTAPTAATPRPAPAAAEAPAASPAAREVSSVRPGTRLVQLGAFDSEEITRKAWSQLVARNGDLLGGKSLYVERTTANARVFYRLRVAGFETSDQTRVMCEQLRARSIDCIPVTLQ